ncbi:epidermal growth factor-like protein 6 isoform X5 [Hemicordylus capensis]|uniref:epidermal growth factor-like protein 6 isoform X5 n=1 Tax=Hemicordylus capensis TaxID=884348 RepID=UPI00230433BD|nr:epidermal growth factor-like protein 6 isoform X5 [Hemicordylus capensis]
MVLLVAWSTFFFALSGLPFAAGGFAEAASSRGRRQLLTVNQPGVCRYGSKLDCCYGWKRNSKEHCEAICEHGCKYGECVMPNKCKCFPGFVGKTCSQDINECGLKPHPCEHRCMNTHGSYKCYCLNGYMLMADGTCTNSRTCAMVNCQYGCEEVKDDVRCLCPSSGLHLAPNGKTCIVIHENSVKEIPRISGVAKEKLKKLLVHKNSVKKHEDIKNVIPEPPVTPASKAHVRPLDYEDSAYIEATYGEQGKGTENARRDGKEEKEAEEEEEERPDLENQTDSEKKLRGDVFSKEAAAFGPAPAQRKIPVQKVELEVDCSFGRGSCAWQQDTNDDFDWNPADHDNGDEYYMAVPAFMGHKKDVGRLNLLLNDLKPKNIYCLIFSYRLAGDRVGKLRVILGNSSSSPSWEQSLGDDDQWRTGQMEVHMGGETTMNITFEAERGKGKSGEIGVDAVVLFSGLCPEDHLTFDT